MRSPDKASSFFAQEFTDFEGRGIAASSFR